MKIMVLVSLLLVGVGILIKHFKWYWMISGYNTMSAEKKKNVDIQGMGNLIGNSMFVIAAILLMGTLLNDRGYWWGIASTIFLMIIFIVYILTAAQKYDHNKKTPKDRIILTVVIIVMVVILGSSVGSIYFESRPLQMEITSENISIRGLYGITIPVSEIRTVLLEDKPLKVLAKTNGFNAGEVLKGNFRLEGLGQVKLFTQSSKGMYVQITTDQGDTVIINHKDPQLTKELYEKLLSVIQ